MCIYKNIILYQFTNPWVDFGISSITFIDMLGIFIQSPMGHPPDPSHRRDRRDLSSVAPLACPACCGEDAQAAAAGLTPG